VPFTEIDRNLLDRCLQKKPRAWEDFVDRCMGLIMHVIRHTAQCRGMRLSREDRDDLCAEVFLAIIRNDFAVLRNFRGQSSLATYLTVVARRVVVRDLLARGPVGKLVSPAQHLPQSIPDPHVNSESQVIAREEVEQLLGGLQGNEALVVRMYHIEGKSYQEISTTVGMPENSIGPILSRAREKLRRAGVDQAVS
jgi:RNA polymerase sigma-70 factor (ECF subfamily)